MEEKLKQRDGEREEKMKKDACKNTAVDPEMKILGGDGQGGAGSSQTMREDELEE